MASTPQGACTTMTDNDPFAPRMQNFVIPTPGARAVPRQNTPASPPPAGGGMVFERIDLTALDWSAGLNPLVAAAAPLLNLTTQLRAAYHPDPVGLRETLARAMQTFETRARSAGIANEHVIGARYALCTFLDETAANTPWGEKIWAQRSLLVQFHNEAWGGEKAFQLLGKLAEQPAQHRNLLELFYIILALGFEGRFRVVQNGKVQLDALRERLAQLLQRERGEAPRELSPAWQTTARATRPLRDSVPLWAIAVMAVLVLFLAYLGASWHLNGQSDPTFSKILALRVPPPAPSKTTLVPPRLQTYLPEEIRQGRIEVRDLADRSIVLVHGDGLFTTGSADLSPGFTELLGRVGAAVGKINGTILVRGHSDNQPIRSARFPSNFHLSQARAEAVAGRLAEQLGSRQKIRSEGVADSEPLVPNDTPEHRALNRRVEIIVFPASAN